VIEPGDADWPELVGRFPAYRSTRAIIRTRLDRIADSCGYGVPQLHYAGERRQLLDWADRKGEEGIRSYQEDNNALSIDGLAGLRRP
jgi:hypothetical protein